MKAEGKTREQLEKELKELRQRIADLEKAETERILTEKALRESEERYRTIFENAVEGIFQATPEGRYLSVNPAWAKMCGFSSPEEMIREVTDIARQLYVNPEDRTEIKRLYEDPGVAKGFETEFRRKDGRVIWVSITARSVRDERGNILYYEGMIEDITRRKQAEKALRESEQKYRILVEHANEGILVAQDGMLRYLNPRLLELSGYSHDEATSRPFTDFIHPDDREMVMQHHLCRLKGEEIPRRYLLRMIDKRGQTRWMENNGVLTSWDGRPATLNLLTDVTEHKRAEEELDRYRDHLEDLVKERTDTLAKVNEQLRREIEERTKAEHALRESRQMLQSVLDTIPVRVFWKDLDSNYLGCNRPFARDAGLQSPEEIIGRNDFEMGWAGQAERYRSDDRVVMATGSPKLGYEEPATVAGDTVWLRTNKVPLLDAEGRIKGILGTYEDITESKRTEEMLRVSETKYRIVADNTYDWEYWTSPEGRFLYTSPSCERVTGYMASDFETDPKLLSRIVHPDDFAQFKAHVQQDQTTGASGIEFRIIHRDGTTRWIGHLCQPVFDAQGLFLGRRGSNRDITDRKQAEKALEDSSHELKLFAYSVAHDLKIPAIGVYGLTKRLSKYAKEVLDEKGRNYCDQILKASEHIAALVDKVNTYIATKEARLSIERISIAEILRTLKDEFAVQLSIRQIDWLQPETTVEIKADRLSMLRAFRNFVDNSLKYGGERLSTIWTGYEESEDFHIFSFSDDGKGLKVKDSEKIFGAFQRNETSRGVEGAGLGLTIVKEIAERHGGRVWVEPTSKKGITFYLSISKNL